MMEPSTYVMVGLSSPSSMDARDDGVVNLRVEDAISGEVLVDVDIPAGRWWRLCQGMQMTRPAFVTPRVHRIGKAMENTSTGVPRSVTDPLGYDKAAQEIPVLAWAQANPPDGWADYDTVSVRRTNSGWQAVYRRWTDDPVVIAERRESAERMVF